MQSLSDRRRTQARYRNITLLFRAHGFPNKSQVPSFTAASDVPVTSASGRFSPPVADETDGSARVDVGHVLQEGHHVRERHAK